jgi:hypothetical protein
MESKICWMCGRDAERVRNDAGGIMWEKDLDPLLEMAFMGEIIEVDKRREIDKWEEGAYVRNLLPPDVVAYYDQERDAMVLMRKHSISLCRICAELIASMPPPRMDHRIHRLRSRGAKDLFTDPEVWKRHDIRVQQLWEARKAEAMKMEATYPQNDFRVLLALMRVKATDGVTLPLLQSITGLLPIQSLFALRNIMKKQPTIGRLFEDTQVFFLNTQIDYRALLGSLMEEYLSNPDNRIIKERVDHGGTIF